VAHHAELSDHRGMMHAHGIIMMMITSWLRSHICKSGNCDMN
jgi:hypothetical protein